MLENFALRERRRFQHPGKYTVILWTLEAKSSSKSASPPMHLIDTAGAASSSKKSRIPCEMNEKLGTGSGTRISLVRLGQIPLNYGGRRIYA